MISRAIAFESAMSEPTSSPSQRSAHCADVVRRGSTTKRRAPLRTPLSRWWKKIGCVSRAFEPQSRITSVSSISWYDDVPPPAPNTVARPTTLGACQVRLQQSMLFVPITWRANFCARKFISFVAFEHEKIPNDVDASAVTRAREARRGAVERLVPGSRAAARPPSRTSGVVRRPFDATTPTCPSGPHVSDFSRTHASPADRRPRRSVGVDCRLERSRREISSCVKPTAFLFAPSRACR